MAGNNTRVTVLPGSDVQPLKPLLVFATPPLSGHTVQLLPHATHLKEHGYDVFFIGGAEFEPAIRRTGATFVRTENTWTPQMAAQQSAIHDPRELLLWQVREKHPGREVVIVQELLYMGTGPFVLGAPLPKGYSCFPKVIAFSTMPLDGSITEHVPCGPGLPSELGAVYRAMAPAYTDLIDYANTAWGALGATEKMAGSTMHVAFTRNAVTVMPCSPSLEYPRSDLSPKIRFIGGTPHGELDPSTRLPAWWGELAANRKSTEAKKVVFVTQGTIEVNYDHLVVPTLEALAGRDDVIVVALLCAEGASLDCDVPENSRVVDYLPYHALLPYSDALVTNGGYNGFMQAVMHGVPMVLAGTSEGKSEVSMLGEWAGVGVNLRTRTPSPEEIRSAVDKVLAPGSGFKARVLEIQRENEELDALAQLERIIVELSAQRRLLMS